MLVEITFILFVAFYIFDVDRPQMNETFSITIESEWCVVGYIF